MSIEVIINSEDKLSRKVYHFTVLLDYASMRYYAEHDPNSSPKIQFEHYTEEHRPTTRHKFIIDQLWYVDDETTSSIDRPECTKEYYEEALNKFVSSIKFK